MEVGAVLVFADLLSGEGQNLVNVVEAFGVDVPGTVSECIANDCAKLTMPGLPVIPAVQSCPVWAAVAS